MTHASNDNGYYFKYGILPEIEFMFGAMMRGENMITELQPYLPLTVDRTNGYLYQNYSEWQQSFVSTMDTSQSAREGMIHG